MVLFSRKVLNVCSVCAKIVVNNKTYSTVVDKTVLRQAIEDIFSSKKPQVFADLTFGTGGHTKALLRSAKDVKVFALDRDPEAFDEASKLASQFNEEQVVPLLGLFSDFPALMMERGVEANSFDGILLETGPSWKQLQDGNRGFNWEIEGLLDMRMDSNRIPDLPTAADVINSLDSVPLTHIFKKYGEEKHAKKIARALVDARYLGRPVQTTTQLAEIVTKTIGAESCTDVQNRQVPSCYKIFNSLRMFINNELNELNYILHVAHRYLKPGGKLVTISYNQMEDRIIKKHLIDLNMENPRTGDINNLFVNNAKWFSQEQLSHLMPKKWTILHRKMEAKVEEVSLNPRSGFAKLRAACKADATQNEKTEVITAELILG